jgi:hypothetical protein
MSCTVYGLAGPDGIIRYIGQTKCATLKERLGWHWRETKRRPHSRVYRWIKETKDISIIALRENEIWDVTEVTLIAEYRKLHPGVLLNQLNGGSHKPARPFWRKKKRGSKRSA